MPEQIRTLTHDRLITHCGVLTPQTVNKVLDKIKALLHIDVIV
jgi:mRNA-degrading endonuclease toxin of MazEF toxin-antitoxin module